MATTAALPPRSILHRTESMPTDPEAHRHGGRASESSSRPFPIRSARCATDPTSLEWVPDRERHVVPDTMVALCRRCPGRQACLLWALAGPEQGYWAGTTTADRAQMRQLELDSAAAADWLQDLARREFTAGALHAERRGSYWWYRRRGCRCGECKKANASQRSRERARVRCRVAG